MRCVHLGTDLGTDWHSPCFAVLVSWTQTGLLCVGVGKEDTSSLNSVLLSGWWLWWWC